MYYLITLPSLTNKIYNQPKTASRESLAMNNQQSLSIKVLFLAPIGAQGVTMSVCPSVCLCGTNLSRAVNLHLLRSESNQGVIKHSESTKRALREHSNQSHINRSLKYCVLFPFNPFKNFTPTGPTATGTALLFKIDYCQAPRSTHNNNNNNNST